MGALSKILDRIVDLLLGHSRAIEQLQGRVGELEARVRTLQQGVK